jgi:S1-C subfamily serine protease
VFLVVGGAVVLGLVIWLASEHYPESNREFVTAPRVTKPAPSTPRTTPAFPMDGEEGAKNPATPSDKVEPKASPAFPNAPGATPPGSLEALVQKLKPAVVFIRAYHGGWKGGEGTGFFISSQGFILTCKHVIDSAQRLRVRTADEQETGATVVWQDKSRDLALVKISSRDGVSVPAQPIIPLAEAQVKEGHPVIVIGYPLGSSLGREPTVTTGILSAIRHRQNGLEALQISAPINPGNSGGPLVSAQTGQALGVVNAKISSASDIDRRNEDSARIEGIGFAVPITQELRQTLEKVWR